MNIKAIEATRGIAELLHPLSQDEQLHVLLFLTEMTKQQVSETSSHGEDDLLSYKEAIAFIGCAPTGLWSWIKRGRLKPVIVEGQGKRLRRSQLQEVKRTYTPRRRRKS